MVIEEAFKLLQDRGRRVYASFCFLPHLNFCQKIAKVSCCHPVYALLYLAFSLTFKLFYYVDILLGLYLVESKILFCLGVFNASKYTVALTSLVIFYALFL